MHGHLHARVPSSTRREVCHAQALADSKGYSEYLLHSTEFDWPVAFLTLPWPANLAMGMPGMSSFGTGPGHRRVSSPRVKDRWCGSGAPSTSMGSYHRATHAAGAQQPPAPVTAAVTFAQATAAEEQASPERWRHSTTILVYSRFCGSGPWVGSSPFPNLWASAGGLTWVGA